MFRSLTTLLTMTLMATALPAAAPPTHLDRALKALKRLVAQQPQDAAAHNDLGNLLMLADSDGQAEEAYRRAIELAPDRTAARYNLALLLHQTDRRKEALAELELLLELDADHAWAHYQMGVILAERGKRRPATRHYAEAFELDPSLTQPEENPLILYNELATRAMLTAYRWASLLETAPRSYENASRITRLLVPETRVSAETPQAGPSEEQQQKRKKRKDRKNRRQKGDSSGDS